MSYSHLIYLARFGYYSPVDITILPGKITIILSQLSTVFQIHQTKFTMFTYHSPLFLYTENKYVRNCHRRLHHVKTMK